MAPTVSTTPATDQHPRPGQTGPRGGADARACQAVAARHARTFSLASRLLPATKRRGAFAIYATCRRADDLVDLSGPGTEEARTALAGFREAAFGALARESDDPVLRELAWTVTHFNVSTSALAEVFDGVAMDLDHRGFVDWPSLRAYSEAVAGSVGEMTVAIFGVDPAHESSREAVVACARKLGVAMQLTNILRDVGEDARRGRCYLPATELEAHGVATRQVLDGSALRERTGWRSFMKGQVSRARELYAEAIPGIALLAPDAQRCATACAIGYSKILDAIEQADYDTFSSRVSASRLTLFGVAWRSWLIRTPGRGRVAVAAAPEPVR